MTNETLEILKNWRSRRSFDPFYGAPVILIVLADRNANAGMNTHKADGSLVLAI